MKTARILILLPALAASWFCSRPVSRNITIYGDSRTQHAIHEAVVAAMVRCRPVAVFNTGDLVTDGFSRREWDIFNYYVKDLLQTAAIYPALGNHEKDSRLYFDNFSLPGNERWYSVDIGSIHFVVLDTNIDIGAGSPQYRWLEEDLKNVHPGIRFKAAVFHHAPFSSSHHPDDEKRLRESILPLFEQYGLDLAFCGHHHYYERLRHHGIYYIVTAGGGAPLYSRLRNQPDSQVFVKRHHFCCLYTRKDVLIVQALDLESNKLDQFKIVSRKRGGRK